MYLLVFVFGYITCRTFYFFRAASVGLSMLRASHIIYLSALVRALTHLSYAREIVREHMIRTERKSTQISFFEIQFDQDVELFKEKGIEVLIYCHPTFFRSMLEFSDWPTAMDFLAEHKETALLFWDKN